MARPPSLVELALAAQENRRLEQLRQTAQLEQKIPCATFGCKGMIHSRWNKTGLCTKCAKRYGMQKYRLRIARNNPTTEGETK